MIYVLDTNAVSALMKGSAAVVERLAATELADLAIPQPVLAEIAFGIERWPRSNRRTALQTRTGVAVADYSLLERNEQPESHLSIATAPRDLEPRVKMRYTSFHGLARDEMRLIGVDTLKIDNATKNPGIVPP